MTSNSADVEESLQTEEPLRSSYTPLPFLVVEKRSETQDTVTLVLSPPEGTSVPRFLPGQFNMLYAFGVGEVAISISGDPAQMRGLVHTIRSVGKVSGALSRKKPGDTVGVRGPYGRGWPLDMAHGKDILIVAGGLGIAPLRPVIYDILNHRELYGRVEIIYGARTPADLLYRDEIQAWRHRTDMRLQVTVDSADRSWYGDVGIVTTRLPDTRFDPSKAVVYLCGPEIMMRLTAQALEMRGVPDASIWLSVERNMKCAIAQCGHCQYGPYFVCRDGPVFSYDKVRPLMTIKEV
jgi:NAD(P)H-flavin reductase